MIAIFNDYDNITLEEFQEITNTDQVTISEYLQSRLFHTSKLEDLFEWNLPFIYNKETNIVYAIAVQDRWLFDRSIADGVMVYSDFSVQCREPMDLVFTSPIINGQQMESMSTTYLTTILRDVTPKVREWKSKTYSMEDLLTQNYSFQKVYERQIKIIKIVELL